MKTKMLVLGSGRMAKAVTLDFLKQKFDVTVASRNAKKAKSIAKVVNVANLDVNNPNSLVKLMKKHDCAVSALPYMLNFKVASAAVRARCHYVDLGGSVDFVKKEFTLNSKAKKNQVSIFPDCGLAPGLVSDLVTLGMKDFKKVDSVEMRVGGLPQHPKPPLNYMIAWSVKGLINEYIEDALVIENYKLKKIPSMQALEKISLPGYINLEAFTTSGGTSTLPQSFKGKVKILNYKTIRYTGHAKKIRLLMGLGLTSSSLIDVKGQKINPRALLEKELLDKLSFKDRDVVLLKVTIKNKRKKVVFELVDKETSTQTAMMRCTGLPVSTIAEMIVLGEIKNRGVLKHEFDIPSEILIRKLRQRGLNIKKKTHYN